MTSWLFRGLNGDYAGAELPLPFGTYILGADPACDIVLELEGLAEQFVTFNVDESGISFRLLTPDQAAPADVAPEWHFWPKYQPILLNRNTVFAYGEEGLDWMQNDSEPVTLFALANGVLSEGDAASEAGDTDHLEGDDSEGNTSKANNVSSSEDTSSTDLTGSPGLDSDGSSGSASPLSDENQAKPLEPNHAVPEDERDESAALRSESLSLENPESDADLQNMDARGDGLNGKKSRIRLKRKSFKGLWSKVAGGMLFVLLVSFFQFFPPNESSAQLQPPNIEAFLADRALGHLSVEPGPVLTIHGDIRFSEDQDVIEQWLRENKVSARLKLNITERLKAAVESILALHAITDITIDYGQDPGVLVASGFISDEVRWRTAMESIRSDLPTLRRLIDNVRSVDTHFVFLKTALSNEGLSEQVHLEKAGTEIHVRLWLHPDRQADWSAVIASFKAVFGSTQHIKTVPVVVKGLSVQGVSLGRKPFITTTDNDRYSIGDMLPNGFFLDAIEKNYLVFVYNGRYAKFPLRRASAS